jgi:hypothetical protein
MPSHNKKVYIKFVKIPYVKNVVHVHHVNTQNRFNIFIIYATSMKAEVCSHCTRKCKMYFYRECMDK